MKILNFPLDKVRRNGKNTTENYHCKVIDFVRHFQRRANLTKLCYLLEEIVIQKALIEENKSMLLYFTQEELADLLAGYAKEIINEYEREDRKGND